MPAAPECYLGRNVGTYRVVSAILDRRLVSVPCEGRRAAPPLASGFRDSARRVFEFLEVDMPVRSDLERPVQRQQRWKRRVPVPTEIKTGSLWIRVRIQNVMMAHVARGEAGVVVA